MTLEHIPAAGRVYSAQPARDAPGRVDSVMYFQVPEAMRILRDCAFEDIYYEHCSYFTAGSLARLLRAEGLELCGLRVEYAGQYLAAEARLPSAMGHVCLDGEDDLDETRSQVTSFVQRCGEKIRRWRAIIEEGAAKGPIAVWGSGSKAVAFLGAVDPAERISRVVDINPYRQGHFMPGSGQPIVAPEALRDTRPATVIIMNAVYRQEIEGELARLGLAPDVYAL
jgi:hypothetical protein